MSDIYQHPVHSHVLIAGLGDGHPRPIAHKTTARTWVLVEFSEKLPAAGVMVSDGLGQDYDADGNRLVSVPDNLCRFYDEEEAGAIEACIDADEQLLRFAR